MAQHRAWDLYICKHNRRTSTAQARWYLRQVGTGVFDLGAAVIRVSDSDEAEHGVGRAAESLVVNVIGGTISPSCARKTRARMHARTHPEGRRARARDAISKNT